MFNHSNERLYLLPSRPRPSIYKCTSHPKLRNNYIVRRVQGTAVKPQALHVLRSEASRPGCAESLPDLVQNDNSSLVSGDVIYAGLLTSTLNMFVCCLTYVLSVGHRIATTMWISWVSGNDIPDGRSAAIRHDIPATRHRTKDLRAS